MYSFLVLFVLATSYVGSTPENCKKDGIIEKSCNQIVSCKNSKVYKTTCKAGEVINFRNLNCEPVEKVPPPCGQVADCSKRADGKYAEIKQKCQTYYTCLGHKFIGHNVCPQGLVFSEADQACDFPFNVVPPCGKKSK